MLSASFSWAGLIVLLVGLIAFSYLAAALSFKIRCKQRAKARFDAARPSEREPPRELARLIGRASKSLGKLGFQPAWHVVAADLVPGAVVMFLIFDNPESSDSAMASLLCLQSTADDRQIARVYSKHLEFTSYFADGRELTTHNSNRDSVTASVSHKRFLQFPDARDPGLLYRLHQRAVQQFARGAGKVSPTGQELLDRVCNDFSRTMQGQCEAGYFYLNAAGDYYRPTWKGSLLMTWKRLWPNSTLRRRRRRRRTRELLRRWGMEEL